MGQNDISSEILVSGYSHFGKAKGRYYEDRIKLRHLSSRVEDYLLL